MDAGVNTGIVDGGNMYGSRHTYNKVKQNHSVYKRTVECRLSRFETLFQWTLIRKRCP